VLAGFPDMVAMRLDQGTLRCALVHGRKGVLARESVVKSPLLVASEVREVSIRGDVETLLTLATAIREEWLRELFPEAFEETTAAYFDTTQRRVLGKKQTRFHDLVLRAEPSLRNLYRTGGAATALDSARVRLYLAEASRIRLGSASPDSATTEDIRHHYRRAIQLGASDPVTQNTARARLEEFEREIRGP